jgi:hypothetical protein
MPLLLVSTDNDAVLTWLESAMRHAFTQGRPELWAYLEAIMEDVMFVMEMAATRTASSVG